MRYVSAACALLLSAPVWALDFERNDAFDYAQEAAAAVARAESLCTGPVNRRGRCPERSGVSRRDAVMAMSRANVSIDNFYLKCEVVFRGDLSACDVMLGAFLTEARARTRSAP